MGSNEFINLHNQQKLDTTALRSAISGVRFGPAETSLLAYIIAMTVDIDVDRDENTAINPYDRALIEYVVAYLVEHTSLTMTDSKQVTDIANQFLLWRISVAKGTIVDGMSFTEEDGVARITGVYNFINPGFFAYLENIKSNQRPFYKAIVALVRAEYVNMKKEQFHE